MQVGTLPDRARNRIDFDGATFAAGPANSDLDLLVVAVAGQPPPRVTIKASTAAIEPSATDAIQEVAYVDDTRPLLSADVADSLAMEARGASSIRVEGTFAVSVWSWNFTVESMNRREDVPTGSYRRDATRDPVMGTDLTWTLFAQVAQLTVTDGWLEIGGAFGASTTLFADAADLAGSGTVLVTGATGALAGSQLAGSEVSAAGEYETVADSKTGPRFIIERFTGDLAIDGVGVDLGDSGPVRDRSFAVSSPGTPSWAWALGIAGLMAMAILVKGPAQVSRFNRIESRFESKDYLGVLTRIDPFTRRARFRRRASFLKAISLLSLEEFKEASLFLKTLSPSEVEPATKAFLQACAAAGLGEDSAVIEHLSNCLKQEPSYIEEIKAVPALTGYLPYFILAGPEEAST